MVVGIWNFIFFGILLVALGMGTVSFCDRKNILVYTESSGTKDLVDSPARRETPLLFYRFIFFLRYSNIGCVMGFERKSIMIGYFFALAKSSGSIVEESTITRAPLNSV